VGTWESLLTFDPLYRLWLQTWMSSSPGFGTWVSHDGWGGDMTWLHQKPTPETTRLRRIWTRSGEDEFTIRTELDNGTGYQAFAVQTCRRQ
jgi:hypothetical protein